MAATSFALNQWYNVYGGTDMRLFITKIWNWWDIAILKWCCLFYGMIAGAYFHEFITHYVWLFLVAAIFLTIRPAIAYWKN